MNDSSQLPQNAYVLPDEKTRYMAVWTDETKLKFRLLYADGVDIVLDKKILPHLVDALFELQNQ